MSEAVLSQPTTSYQTFPHQPPLFIAKYTRFDWPIQPASIFDLSSLLYYFDSLHDAVLPYSINPDGDRWVGPFDLAFMVLHYDITMSI